MNIIQVIDAPKINKRKKVVPKDYDESDAVEEKRAYRKKPSGEFVKAAGSGRYK